MKNILGYPFFYNLFSAIVGGNRAPTILQDEYIKSDKGKRVLDLGCGTARIINYLDFKEYIGVDSNDKYINTLKTALPNKKLTFHKCDVNVFFQNNKEQFDIVLLLGVMHHLNDNELKQCLLNIKQVLKPDGRLITIDGCMEPSLSLFARFMLKNDRGSYVRTKEGYANIFMNIFDGYKYSVRKDLLKIPYNHIIFFRE